MFFDGYGPIVYTGPAVHRASTGRRGRYIHECKILHCIMRVNISPNFATLSFNLGMLSKEFIYVIKAFESILSSSSN